MLRPRPVCPSHCEGAEPGAGSGADADPDEKGLEGLASLSGSIHMTPAQ